MLPMVASWTSVVAGLVERRTCWFGGGHQRTQVNVLVGPDRGLDRVAPKTRKGVMGDSPCADASCVVPATCCRALASNAWRSVPWESSADVCGAGTGVTGDGSASGHCRMGVVVDSPASGHCRMGVVVDSPAGCSCSEAVVVGADVDARAAGGRGRVLLARAS